MEQLISSYKQGNVILFIGAGVSMNLGLPSWKQLIEKIATELEYDPEIYKTLGTDLALAEYYRVKKGSLGKLRSWMDRTWHSPDIKVETSKVHEHIANSKFNLLA